MINRIEGLESFEDQLDPALLRAIRSWAGHPELNRLFQSLHAHSDERTFYNALAEAMVARQLLAHDFSLRFEVPTPSGKTCDFEVVKDDLRFYLHVKRLSTDRPHTRRLAISSRLRLLERIARPYVVNIRWHEGLTDRQMQRIVAEGEQFIRHARLGDEVTVREPESDRELGGLRIVAPAEGTHVQLAIGLPSGFNDETIRLRKLIRRAYSQFMPRAANVILIGTSHEADVADMESALLGTHIERWDRYPPRGRRIAHGRAEDGFWTGRRNDASRVAAWIRFTPSQDHLVSRLWLRDDSIEATSLGRALHTLFAVPDEE